MPGTILVVYGTKHGSTREVAEVLAASLARCGLDVEPRPAGEVDDLSPYAGVVVGGAIYMGRWHPDAVGFMQRHRHALATLPVAVFGMGPRTMNADEEAASLAQIGKSLAKVPEVDPYAIAVFGGVIDPRKLRFPLSRLPASDARDWDAIREWAFEIAPAFDFGKTAETARHHRSELQHVPR